MYLRRATLFSCLLLAISLSSFPLLAQEYVYVGLGGANAIAVIDASNNTVILNLTNVIAGASSPSAGPCSIGFTFDGSLGYVTNFNSANIAAYNVALQIRAIQPGDVSITAPSAALPNGAFGVVFSPDGKTAYVANQGVGSISVLDVQSNAVTGTIALQVGQAALAIAISPDGSKLYVSNSGSTSVAIINTATKQVITNVQVGGQAAGLSVTPDGTRVYAVVPTPGTVAVISTATNAVIATIPVGSQPNGITVSSGRAYVANYNSNNVSVIDLSSNTVVATIAAGANPSSVAIGPKSGKIFVANTGGQSVTVIDPSSNGVTATIPLSGSPCATGTPSIAVSPFPPTLGGAGGANTKSSCGGPDAGTLWFSALDGSVASVNLNTLKPGPTIPASALPGGATPIIEREIAYDPVTCTMYYSGIDGIVRSINVASLAPGPQITGFATGPDTVNRHLFVDYNNRKLLVDIDDGSVSFYNLADLSPAGGIPATFFTDGNVGYYRHFAADMRAGTLWFADTQGGFNEMDPNTLTLTGRKIPFGPTQKGANPGAFRHFVIDPTNNLLLYVVTDGSLASISLWTMKDTALKFGAQYFPGSEAGAGKTITSAFNFTRPGHITAAGVVNAASFITGPVAPGEIISIFGTNIGPATAAGATFNSFGLLGTSLGGASVLFDSVPAPMVYASALQINAIVPYSVAGKTTTNVQVVYPAAPSNTVSIPVATSAPGIFTVSGGKGQAALLNQDMSPNSSANPAAKGSTIVIYATGEGQTNPPGVDGKPSPSSPPFPQAVLPVTVTIGGQTANVVFNGSAPGFVGLLQINAQVPATVASGNVPVVITVGTVQSQAGVTMAVK